MEVILSRQRHNVIVVVVFSSPLAVNTTVKVLSLLLGSTLDSRKTLLLFVFTI